jgi:hypothetical protein
MHIKTNMLDGVGDVGAGECQVLKGLNEAPKLSWISNRTPKSGRDFGLCVHGRQDWLAVHHASALKNIKSKLALSEKESIGLMLYGDPQKMVKRTKILHGEFPLESRYSVLQERCARCGEHNVINTKQQVYRASATVEDE